MIICLIFVFLIVVLILYAIYQVDKDRIEGMRRAELERTTAAAMRYDRQMARLKAHNMKARYRRAI